MGYSSVDGPAGKGLGSFTNTAQTASDLNKLVELIGRMGNVRVGSQAERDALTGTALYDGLLFVDEDSGALYRYDGGWQAVFVPATAPGSVLPTPGASFTLSNNALYTRNGLLLGTIDWARTSGTLSHADDILVLPAGARPSHEYVIGFVGGPSPSQIGHLIVQPTGQVRALSPIAGRTSGSLKFVVPISL